MRGKNLEVVTKTKLIMGGNFTIISTGVSENQIDEVFQFLKSLEKKWSRFDSTSEISRLNNSEGNSITVSTETIELINKTIHAHRITKGFFDPTTLPILLDAGYIASRKNKNKVTVIPSSARWPGNLDGIEVSKNTVTIPVGTTLDAGGIGKGFAADLALQMLKDLGAEGALVNANGDVVMTGEAPQGGPWIIGIENPLDDLKEIDQVRISNGAISTSSKVHQTWLKDGLEVNHLVNPLTGSTAVTSVLSSSVICATGADSEALAKIPFILEIDLALNLISEIGAECLIVDENLKLHKTAGWDKFK